MKKRLLVFTILFLMIGWQSAKAQMLISGELRPRTEYRHGLKELFQDSHDAALFVSQRTRLNFNYTKTKYKVGLSLQDVRVWGDVKQLNLSDKNKFMLHEAWGEVSFSDKISLKVGRQEMVYDDSRILGNVGWAQQARSHDLALLKMKFGTSGQFHIGIALNNDAETLSKQLYQTSYKNMQLAWYHNKLNKLNFSLLFLNVGQEDANSDINYSQTFGTYLTYNLNKLKLNGAVYGQTGKNKAGQDLKAYMFDLNMNYPITNKWKAKAGLQWLSGTDSDEMEEDHSFTPLFGTNHKFNGHMDYFYVGNHIQSVGLIDINAGLNYAQNKFSFGMVAHMFSAQANLYNGTEKADTYLGTEIDLACGYKYSKEVNFKAGYSQMFASDTMELLKSGDKSEMQNWAWIMVVFKPTFFFQK